MVSCEITDVLNDLARFERVETTIHGHLYVTGDDRSFLCVDFDGFVSGNGLPINDGGRIAKQLLNTFPVYGGGPCIYAEEAWITGRISGGVLTSLKRWRIVRDEYELDEEA